MTPGSLSKGNTSGQVLTICALRKKQEPTICSKKALTAASERLIKDFFYKMHSTIPLFSLIWLKNQQICINEMTQNNLNDFYMIYI